MTSTNEVKERVLRGVLSSATATVRQLLLTWQRTTTSQQAAIIPVQSQQTVLEVYATRMTVSVWHKPQGKKYFCFGLLSMGLYIC